MSGMGFNPRVSLAGQRPYRYCSDLGQIWPQSGFGPWHICIRHNVPSPMAGLITPEQRTLIPVDQKKKRTLIPWTKKKENINPRNVGTTYSMLQFQWVLAKNIKMNHIHQLVAAILRCNHSPMLNWAIFHIPMPIIEWTLSPSPSLSVDQIQSGYISFHNKPSEYLYSFHFLISD